MTKVKEALEKFEKDRIQALKKLKEGQEEVLNAIVKDIELAHEEECTKELMAMAEDNEENTRSFREIVVDVLKKIIKELEE